MIRAQSSKSCPAIWHVYYMTVRRIVWLYIDGSSESELLCEAKPCMCQLRSVSISVVLELNILLVIWTGFFLVLSSLLLSHNPSSSPLSRNPPSLSLSHSQISPVGYLSSSRRSFPAEVSWQASTIRSHLGLHGFQFNRLTRALRESWATNLHSEYSRWWSRLFCIRYLISRFSKEDCGISYEIRKSSPDLKPVTFQVSWLIQFSL